MSADLRVMMNIQTSTVVCEDSVKENVEEEDLYDDIEKVEQFTNSKLKTL